MKLIDGYERSGSRRSWRALVVVAAALLLVASAQAQRAVPTPAADAAAGQWVQLAQAPASQAQAPVADPVPPAATPSPAPQEQQGTPVLPILFVVALLVIGVVAYLFLKNRSGQVIASVEPGRGRTPGNGDGSR